MIGLLWLAAATAAPAVGPKPVGFPWITDQDYPAAERNRGFEGVTSLSLVISIDGRVKECLILAPSGSTMLDATACVLLKERARFTPAENAKGKAIEAAYFQRITWRIPQAKQRTELTVSRSAIAARVRVSTDGQIESCRVLEGEKAIALGQPSPCMSFPLGSPAQLAMDKNGKPIGYSITMRMTYDFTPD